MIFKGLRKRGKLIQFRSHGFFFNMQTATICVKLPVICTDVPPTNKQQTVLMNAVKSVRHIEENKRTIMRTSKNNI